MCVCGERQSERESPPSGKLCPFYQSSPFKKYKIACTKNTQSNLMHCLHVVVFHPGTFLSHRDDKSSRKVYSLDVCHPFDSNTAVFLLPLGSVCVCGGGGGGGGVRSFCFIILHSSVTKRAATHVTFCLKMGRGSGGGGGGGGGGGASE